MRRLLLTPLIFALISVITPLYASHVIGGSITWECIKTPGPNYGKYIFTVVQYRKCALSASPTIGVPLIETTSFGNIPTTLVSQIDLSPGCFDPSQEYDCYGGAGKQDHAVEEFIFKSAPVSLSGTPPASGLVLSVSDCCRPSGLTNVTSTGGYIWRAIMYPRYVNGTPLPLNVCYDNSPEFAEKPQTNICTGNQYNFSNFVTDADGDELRYRWAHPWTTGGVNVTFSSGYSYDSPLPSPGVPSSAGNVAATLDSLNGIMSFKAYDAGKYVQAVQIDSYRDGQRIASVIREIPLQLHNCPPLPPPFSSIYNVPPSIVFILNGTPYAGNLRDTVYAGEIVNFELQANDGGLLPGLIPQTLAIKPVSAQLGSEFADSASGCNRPPCAVLDTSSIYYDGASDTWKGVSLAKVKLHWKTECQHVSPGPAMANGTTYDFYFDVYDNYCPIPGRNIITASITVLPDTATSGYMVVDSVIKTASDVTLHWQQYTGGGFVHYRVYKYNPANQSFDDVASITNVATTSYTDNTPGPFNIYFVSLDANACPPDIFYSDIDLNVSANGTNAGLVWNPAIENYPGNITYKIYRGNGINPPVLIDSTINLTAFNDSISGCDTLIYYVEAYKDGIYFTTSLSDTIYSTDLTGLSVHLDYVLADSAGNVTLGWDTLQGNSSIFNGYVIYVSTDSSGPYIVVDTVTQQGVGSYFHNNAGADTTELYYLIKIWGHSNCTGTDTLSKRSNILSTLGLNIMNMNNGTIQLTWSPFFSQNSKTPTGFYSIEKRFGSTPWSVIGITYPGNESYLDSVSICNEDIYYRVSIDSMGIIVSITGDINISGYEGELEWINNHTLKGPIGISHTWYLNGVILKVPNSNEFIPTENGTYQLVVENANGCIVTTQELTITSIGITSNKENIPVEIFPNPHTGIFNVALDLSAGKPVSMVLIDNTGRTVYAKNFSSTTDLRTKEIIDISDRSRGLYLLKIAVDGNIYTHKILFQ